MKIVSVSHYYPPHVGGLEIVAQKQAKALALEGHRVSVVTCMGQGEDAGVADESGVIVYRIWALNIFEKYFTIPFPIAGLGLFIRLWKEISKADIVQVHDVFYQTSWLAYLCAVMQKKPMLLTQHVGWVEHPSALLMWIQRVVYATWGTLIFNYAGAIIVYNETVKTFVVKRTTREKVLEMRNGADLSLFHPASEHEKAEARREFGFSNERPLILFVGRFVPKKGASAVFEARDSAYDLVFAGSGEVKPEWRKTPGVHWLGPLTQTKLATLYRAVDVFVCPVRGELFTLTMQEACASGLPVITTDDPAYRTYNLDKRGIAFVEPTAPVLKRAMYDLVADKKLRLHMAAYSLKLARERFNEKVNIQQVLDLYAEMAKKQPPVIVTTSWDDGHVLDHKLAARLLQHGVAGTFFIAPENRELSQDERLGKEGVLKIAKHFEIGAHTLTHPYLPAVDNQVAQREILASKRVLEDWTLRPIKSFCYPKGGYTPAHQHMLQEAGFTHARGTQRFSLTRGDDPYALQTSVHTYDHWLDVWSLAVFVRFNPFKFWSLYRRWDAQAIALFNRALLHGGVFHLWGHSWEIEKNNDWDRLERVLKHISGHPTVRYVTNAELV